MNGECLAVGCGKGEELTNDLTDEVGHLSALGLQVAGSLEFLLAISPTINIGT